MALRAAKRFDSHWLPPTARFAGFRFLEQGGELAPALPDSPALPAAITHFLEASQARHLKTSTLDSYETSLAHLSASLGTIDVSRVDTTMLDRYRAGRQIAATTWRKELETLRAFFARCLDRKWIAENPAKKLRMPNWLADVRKRYPVHGKRNTTRYRNARQCGFASRLRRAVLWGDREPILAMGAVRPIGARRWYSSVYRKCGASVV